MQKEPSQCGVEGPAWGQEPIRVVVTNHQPSLRKFRDLVQAATLLRRLQPALIVHACMVEQESLHRTGRRQVQSAKIAATQVGVRQIGTRTVGVTKDRVDQPARRQVGGPQHGVSKVAELRSGKIDFRQIGRCAAGADNMGIGECVI